MEIQRKRADHETKTDDDDVRQRLPAGRASTIERLERALAVCAHLVVRDGPVVVPILERLERELAAMRSNEATVVRAKALLAR
jgi:hypothetical protein